LKGGKKEMKKLLLSLLVMSVFIISVIPGVFAYGSAGSLGGGITVGEEDPLVWQCGDRIMTDENVQPWRFSGDNSFLDEENVVVSAADRIIDLQYTDGSWDWDVTDDVGPTGITYLNIAGVTAEVLLDAYELTGDIQYLNAAKDAGDYLITQIGDPQKTQRQNVFSIVFLYNLYDASGENQYKNEADAILDHVLYEDNYWTNNNGNNCGTDGCTASELLKAYKNFRSWSGDPTGIVVWDLYKFVEAAQRGGEASFALDMANEIKNYLDQPGFISGIEYYELGLSAGILGLGNAGLDYSDYLSDLLARQKADGSFSTTEPVQTTAYALMALKYAGETGAANDAASYLVIHFGYPTNINGWKESDGFEYSEVTSEAAQALFDYIGARDFLYERAGNYLFDGEKFKVDVVVFDKNKIDSVDVDLILSNEIGTRPLTGDIVSDNLCYKGESTGWQCGENPDQVYANAVGSVTYNDLGTTLDIEVELTGLKPNTDYQLTLNGRNGGDGNTELGGNCDNPNAPASGYAYAWECGTWAGGTGQEGFWNFDMTATTDSSGNFHDTYSLEMPTGHYGIGGPITFGVGFIVKEAADVPGGSNYPPVLMEQSGLDWRIIDIPIGEYYTINCVEISDVDFENCNARIDEEEITVFDEGTMQAYECSITILDSEHMYGQYWFNVIADDGLSSGVYDEATPLWLNPIITLAIDGSLDFEDVRPGTSSYSQVSITNEAEGGVALDMFITGKDWPSVTPGSLGRCMGVNSLGIETGTLENYLSLGAFRYYAENGAFTTRFDEEVDDGTYDLSIVRDSDSEGYVNIHEQLNAGFEEAMFDEAEIIQQGGPVSNGLGYRANVLNQGALMALTFRLDLPEPCYGEFESPTTGSVFIWGEAI
jgi:hypothetical protein